MISERSASIVPDAFLKLIMRRARATVQPLRKAQTIAACTRDLVTIEDILAFLDEWPPARRGPIREQVRRICLAVYAGEATTEDARKAFVSFARLMNVLEPTFDPVPSYDAKPRRLMR